MREPGLYTAGGWSVREKIGHHVESGMGCSALGCRPLARLHPRRAPVVCSAIFQGPNLPTPKSSFTYGNDVHFCSCHLQDAPEKLYGHEAMVRTHAAVLSPMVMISRFSQPFP